MKENMGVSEKVLQNLEGLESSQECIRRSIVSVQDEWRSYAEHLEEVQKNLVKGFAELDAKQRDLELGQKSFIVESKKLDLIRESLDEKLKRTGEEEKAFYTMHGSVTQELELKSKELDFMAKNYVEKVKGREEKLKEQAENVEGMHGRLTQELELKGKELDLMAKNCTKEVECTEEKVSEQDKLVEGTIAKIDLEKKEIWRIKELEEKILQLDQKLKHQEKENEFWLTWIMKRQNEMNAERELKDQRDQLMDNLISKRKKLEERELEIELKEHALETLEEELDLKKKVADFIEELSNKRLKELDFREKELDRREKQLESVKKFNRDCFKVYLQKKKEYKLKKEFLEDRIKEVELKKEKLDLIEKQCSDFLSARLNGGIVENVVDNGGANVSHADLRFVVTMDGKGLQIFLNERTNDLGTMGEEVFKALHLSLDPAKLVLDAMEGFYPPHLRNGNIEFDATVVRRSCIVILEQLAKISPIIQPHVRDEAIKIAIGWKAKLMTSNVVEVLGFLLLLASYKLASAFDAEEITILLGTVAHHQQTPELCHRLGFSTRAHVLILKRYLEHFEETANEWLKNDLKSQEAQKDAVDQKIAAARTVTKCIKDHNLESEYSLRSVEEYITQLLAQKERNGFFAVERMPEKQSKAEVHQIFPEDAVVSSMDLSNAPTSSKNNINPQPMTVILANMNGKEWLSFLKEHISELGLLCYHISSALKLSNDSAVLVLDAIKELYNSMHKEETEDEASRKWRSCILLLQQLRMITVDIKEEIKEEAGKLAAGLKERIQRGTRNPLVIFGVFLFVYTFSVTPPFDMDELLGFYSSGSHDRLVARLCQALGISETISESILPQCLDEVLQHSLRNLLVDDKIDSMSTVPGLHMKCFFDVGDTKEGDHNSISCLVPAFICKASDPACLVLDALMSCYHSMCRKRDNFKLIARSFFQLLQQLTRVSPDIKPHVRDKARRFSFDWKPNWSLHSSGQESSWEALAFLQLIASYKLPFSFDTGELHVLQEAAYQPKEAISLFRSLGLVDKIPSLISNLIKNQQWVLALTYTCEFKLVDKFPPVPLLKNHILRGKRLGKKKCAENHNTAEAQDKAVIIEISAVNTAIRSIHKYGLETEFPPDELINQVTMLQKQRMSLPSRPPRSEQQQLTAADEAASVPGAELPQEVMKKRSALAAGIIQPAKSPRLC